MNLKRRRMKHEGLTGLFLKKCSIIQQNCEGCQLLLGMSLLLMMYLQADYGLKSVFKKEKNPNVFD